MELEENIRTELLAFYEKFSDLDGAENPANMYEESRTRKKGISKGKLARRIYYSLIAIALAFEIPMFFDNKVNSEIFREQMRTKDSVVFMREQKRAYPFTVYQATAFKRNETVYDEATRYKPLAEWHVERAIKKLESLEDGVENK